MNIEQLEFNLNKGNNFGLNKSKDDSILGWIILSKRTPVERFFERFEEDDNPKLWKEQMDIKENPYNVWIAELKTDLYNSGKFPGNDDYILNVNYAFKSLEEVELFLKSLDVNLSQLKWSAEVKFF